MLSLCIQIHKEKNVRNSEQKIINVIALKHALDLVKPLHSFLANAKNALFQTYYQVSINKGCTLFFYKTMYKSNVTNLKFKIKIAFMIAHEMLSISFCAQFLLDHFSNTNTF